MNSSPSATQPLPFYTKVFYSIVISLIVLYLAQTIISGATEILNQPWKINIPFLLAGFFIFILSQVSINLCWHLLLRFVGVNLPFLTNLRLWTVSALGRYIPGGIWNLVGRAHLYSKQAVSVQVMGLAMVLEHACLVLSGIMVVFIFLDKDDFESRWLPSSFFLLLILLIGMTIWRGPIKQKWIKWFSHNAGNGLPKIRLSRLIYMGIMYSLQFIILGLAFFFCVNAVVGSAKLSWGDAIGIYTAAWLTGFLSFFAPSGIGVREGVLFYLLSPYFSAPMAATLAVLSRIWFACGELFFLGLVLLTGPQRAISPRSHNDVGK